MSIHCADDERGKILGVLREALVLSGRMYDYRDEIDDEDYERMSKVIIGIEKKALSLFLCENDDSLEKLLSASLRCKFYEESSAETFKLDRFLNEVDGKSNAVF